MSTENTPMRGVTGEHTTNGTPRGATSLTPFLAIENAREAVEFYREIFGARLVDATEMGGMLVHADLDFGQGHLQLGVPSPQFGLVPPPAGEEACYSLGLYCPNVDEVLERALAAGAVLREPATTFVSGDRYASIRDPFGVRWSVMSRVEDLTEEESNRRVAQWAQEPSNPVEYAAIIRASAPVTRHCCRCVSACSHPCLDISPAVAGTVTNHALPAPTTPFRNSANLG